MKLIDKDTLVAGIQRRIESYVKQRKDMLNVQCRTLADDAFVRICELRHFQDFLDTLEVKEVDLEKEIKNYLDNQPIVTRGKGVNFKLVPSPETIAKHFFELGLKAQKGEEV